MPPIVRRGVRPRTPPKTQRRVLAGSFRKPSSQARKSVLASYDHIDALDKVRKYLHSNNAQENPAQAEVENPRSNRLKVAVRIRPLNSRETAANSRNIIGLAPPNMLIFDPKVEQEEFFFHNRKQIDVTAKKYKNQKFAFDHVYGNDARNEEIFQDVMQPLLTTLLSGFNCSVFAYGATGSGKTYTMLGNQDNPGLTYLTMNELYERLGGLQEQFETQIVISYFEVYNEQVRDLLNPTGVQLQVREVGTGIEIVNLTFHPPKDVNHLLSMLQSGNLNRSQHPTDHNSESSRSHAVLQVHIHLRERFSNMNTNSKTAKLVMVDLAGSEKGSATGCSGQRFREGSSINRSLLALSNCISALASGRKFYSFRDSKLTRILKDSLGGNCRTVMIANVSPSSLLYDDTLNTLRYAEKAKKISCNARKNIITVHACLTQYTQVVEEMTTKLENLESQVTAQNKQLVDIQEENDMEQARLKQRIRDLEAKVASYEERGVSLEQPSHPSWIPGPSAIPEAGETVNTLNNHIQTKQLMRPGVETFLMEFPLKAKRYEAQHSLSESTGDPRYAKEAVKLEKQINAMIEKLDKDLQNIEDKEHAQCQWTPKTTWDSEVTAQTPLIKIPSMQLFISYMNHFKAKDLNNENALLRQQNLQLITDLLEKEDLLKDAATMANQMMNLLNFYNHGAPSLQEQYNTFVKNYSRSVVRFMDNVRDSDHQAVPMMSQVIPAEMENGQGDASAVYENCDLEVYYKDMLERLEETLVSVEVESYPFRAKFMDVLNKAKLRGSKSRLAPVYSVVVVPEHGTEGNQLDENGSEAQRTEESNTSIVVPLEYFVDPSITKEQLLEFLKSSTHSSTSNFNAVPDLNTTVIVAHNLEETFTKEEDNKRSETSAGSLGYVPTTSFKLPTIDEVMVIEGSASSDVGNDIGASTSITTDGSSVKLPESGLVSAPFRPDMNVTVTVAHNLEETFTKEDDCMENTCPQVSSSALACNPSNFKLPTPVQGVVDGPASKSIGAKATGPGSAGANRERPVFLPIQLSGPKPAEGESTSSGLKRTRVVTSSSNLRGVMKSPGVNTKKVAVNVAQSSTNRRQYESTSAKKFKPNQPPRGNNSHSNQDTLPPK